MQYGVRLTAIGVGIANIANTANNDQGIYLPFCLLYACQFDQYIPCLFAYYMLAILCRILAEGGGVGPTRGASGNGGATNKIFLI